MHWFKQIALIQILFLIYCVLNILNTNGSTIHLTVWFLKITGAVDEMQQIDEHYEANAKVEQIEYKHLPASN